MTYAQIWEVETDFQKTFEKKILLSYDEVVYKYFQLCTSFFYIWKQQKFVFKVASCDAPRHHFQANFFLYKVENIYI